jgi:hypothetical protein
MVRPFVMGPLWEDECHQAAAAGGATAKSAFGGQARQTNGG